MRAEAASDPANMQPFSLDRLLHQKRHGSPKVLQPQVLQLA